VAENAENYVKHHVTGQFYTAMSLILRKAPYRWSAEKVTRLIGAICAIINDLDEGTICDADLVSAAEKYGIRVLWNADHEYISEVSIYEEGCEYDSRNRT